MNNNNKTTITNTINTNINTNTNNKFGKIASAEMFVKFIREGKLTTKNELLILNYLVSTTYGGFRPVHYTNHELSLMFDVSTVTISKSLIALKEQEFIHMYTIRKKYGGSKFRSQRTIILNKEKYYGTEEERLLAAEEVKALLKKAKETEQKEQEENLTEQEVIEEPQQETSSEPIELNLIQEPVSKKANSYDSFEF